MLLAILVFVTKGYAHDTEILKCQKNLKVESVKKLDEHLNENGTISEAYDRNGDGKIDIEAISHILSVRKNTDSTLTFEHAPHPFMYAVDTDYDGEPDLVYVDKSGTGKCEDIVLYEDLNEPRQKRESGTL